MRVYKTDLQGYLAKLQAEKNGHASSDVPVSDRPSILREPSANHADPGEAEVLVTRNVVLRGYIPPDDRQMKMYAVYQACEEAHVALPAEVAEYFQGRRPHADGQLVCLAGAQAVTVSHEQGKETWWIDLRNLSSEITALEIVVSLVTT